MIFYINPVKMLRLKDNTSNDAKNLIEWFHSPYLNYMQVYSWPL